MRQFVLGILLLTVLFNCCKCSSMCSKGNSTTCLLIPGCDLCHKYYALGEFVSCMEASLCPCGNSNSYHDKDHCSETKKANGKHCTWVPWEYEYLGQEYSGYCSPYSRRICDATFTKFGVIAGFVVASLFITFISGGFCLIFMYRLSHMFFGDTSFEREITERDSYHHNAYGEYSGSTFKILGTQILDPCGACAKSMGGCVGTLCGIMISIVIPIIFFKGMCR